MTGKASTDQFDEFFEQMDQTARLYQRAVMLLAAERVAEIQDALDAQVVQVHRPKPPFRQKVGTIVRNLLRRFTPHPLDERKRRETPGDIQPTMIDAPPLPWPLDQSLLTNDDIDIYTQISHPNGEKKGDQSHE